MKPIILSAFADDSLRPLDQLSQEREAIRQQLAYAIEEDLCELIVLERADINGILSVFQQNPNRIAVFHYAGHAESFELCLELANGQREIADAGGFAEFLGLQRGLELVFLNGCSTRAQVDNLLKARVGAVIATSQAINDAAACHFATHFYQSLGMGDGVFKAFQESAASVKMRLGTGQAYRSFYWEGQPEDPERFPWEFFTSLGSEISGEWNLPDAAGNPLFGLPKPPQLPLPDQPFRFLKWFREADAEIFFGRSYQIRSLYDHCTNSHTPSIVHLYGRSGVGKSSLLAAGLLPRLKGEQTVIYVRRDQELGLLKTMASVLNCEGRAESISEAWLYKEELHNRPLTLILDQIEEVYTRPHENLSDELAEFLEGIHQIFLSGDSSPQGKLVLAYRKEYLAELENQFIQSKIAYGKFFLENLQKEDVINAVKGLTLTPRTRDKYQLNIEASLPVIIADDIEEDRSSAIAPTLQVLLSKLWEQSPVVQGKRAFTIETYQRLKKQGILLSDFLHQKLDEIRDWNPEVINSGLVLDILNFHTTPLNTAARHSKEELNERYPTHTQLLPALITELKNRYLLVEVLREGEQEFDLSLAHDTLAPLIRSLADNSDSSIQRAHRILLNKTSDFQEGKTKNHLDVRDLEIVEAAEQAGMRAFSEEEGELLRISRIERAKKRRTRRRVIGGGIVALTMIIGSSFFAFDRMKAAEKEKEVAQKQSQRAQSNDLTTQANYALDNDQNPTEAFRLAAGAWLIDSTNVKAKSALIRSRYESGTFSMNGKTYSSPMHRTVGGYADRIAFSPDGNYLLFENYAEREGLSDGPVVQVRDLEGKLLATVQGRLVSFSRDGQLFATTDYLDRQHLAFIWDFQGNKKGDVPQYAQQFQTGVSFDWENNDLKFFPPDDYALVSSSAQKLLPDSIPLHSFSPGDPGVSFYANLSHDGRLVAATGRDFVYRVWNRDGSVKVNFPNTQQSRVYADFSFDAQYLATAQTDGTADIWDLKPSYGSSLQAYENRRLTLKGHEDQLYHIKFSAQGDKLLTTSRDGTARLWKLNAFPLPSLDKLNSFEYAGAFASSQQVYAASYSTLKSQDGQGNAPFQVKGYFVQGLINSVAVSPDEKYIAKTDHQQLFLLDTEGKVLFQQSAHDSDILSLEFSSHGHYLVTSDAKDVKVWDLTGKKIAVLPGRGGKGEQVFQPLNKPFLIEQASGLSLVIEQEKEVIITDMLDKEIARFQGTLGTEANARHIFSPDYQYMIVMEYEPAMRIKLIDLENYQVVAQRSELNLTSGSALEMVKFAVDDPRYILAAESYAIALKVWDWKRDTLISFDPQYQLNTASMSTQAGYIVTQAIDSQIRFWDLNGEELFQLQNSTAEFVDLSPDGQYLIVGRSPKVEFWPLDSEVLIEQARDQGLTIPPRAGWLEEIP